MSDLRNEMRKDMGDLCTEMGGRMEALRTDVHRSTALVTEMLFQHAERITKLENK